MTSDATHVVEIDAAEVACLIVEHLFDTARPEGLSAQEAIHALSIKPELHTKLQAATVSIIEYFMECFEDAKRVS